MKNYSINKIVGIQVDESYIWIDTLGVSVGVGGSFSVDEDDFKKCKSFIHIEQVKRLCFDNCRPVSETMYIGDNLFIDKVFGVMIERKNSKLVHLSVTQECNEWLQILVQLALLEHGCSLIHAAGIESGGNAIVLPSWGGVGKTATIVKFINKGWKLLGDDNIIIRGREALPFLKPFVIYPYHAPLFPSVFKNKGNRIIITGDRMNSLMNKAIPTAKKILRNFPHIHAWARKNNPQSMRVAPDKIFSPESLSDGGTLKKAVWIERVTTNEITYRPCSAEYMASKTSAVSILELYASRLGCVLTLCGAGIFDYNKSIIQCYTTPKEAFEGCECYILEIPLSVDITKVGDIVVAKALDED